MDTVLEQETTMYKIDKLVEDKVELDYRGYKVHIFKDKFMVGKAPVYRLYTNMLNQNHDREQKYSWAVATINLNFVEGRTSIIPPGQIAVKDYSENRGMVDWMRAHGLIKGKPVQVLQSGYVNVPVYLLTEEEQEAHTVEQD